MSTPIKGEIEALIFASPEPLPLERIKKLIPAPEEEIIKTLQELQDEYQKRGGGFILEESGGGYLFRTREEYRHLIRELLKVSPLRLSRPQLEVLAIVAYRQPITRGEIEAIRGVDSSGPLRALMEAGFVAVVGEKDAPGRPRCYGTTPYFLKFFGLNELKELPPLPPELLSQGFMSIPNSGEGSEEGEQPPSITEPSPSSTGEG